MMHSDDLDQVIARAMRARPAPRRLDDLAARAMARARSAERSMDLRKARLRVFRRRNQLVNLAACLLVGLLVTLALLAPAGSPPPEAGNAMVANSSWADLGDSMDTSTSQMDIELICGAILLSALLFVAIEQSTAAPPRVAFG